MTDLTATEPAARAGLGESALLAGLPERRGFGDATLIRLGTGTIDLGGGNPDTAVLPVELYRDATLAATGGDGFRDVLRYSAAGGTAGLRAEIARRSGVAVERILITNGGAHGLALAALGALDRGDTIVVDDPVYPLFLRTLDLIGVRVESVPVGAEGLEVDRLRERLQAGLRPTAVFTVPTFHNPSGPTLSEEKATALVELAEHYGFTVIADDPYREIAFPGTVVPERARLRDSDRVVSVNTFSKTLGPGLRLGWLVLPEQLVHPYTKLRNRLDGQSSGVLQDVVARMLADDRFDPAIAAVGAVYAEKARLLADALRAEFGDAVSFDEPEGGFFLWARLGGDRDFGRVFETAQDLGVTYQRGEWFGATGQDAFRGHVRLSFSESEPAALVEGAARLARAWRESA